MLVQISENLDASPRKITFDWTSAADGSASGVTLKEYSGQVLGFVTVPSAVDVPTADYDIAITDEDGVDVLHGLGANRSDTATEHVGPPIVADLGIVVHSTLTFTVAAAGDTKKGTAFLYVSRG